MENYPSLATHAVVTQFISHQQRWPRPLPGAILIPPALLVVANLPMPSWFTSIKDFNLIRSQPGQLIQRCHIHLRFRLYV